MRYSDLLMKILLKNATVLDPSSPFHSNHQDILINSGVITQIANKIKLDKIYFEYILRYLIDMSNNILLDQRLSH